MSGFKVKSCSGCKACCEGWLSTRVDGQRLTPGVGCVHRSAEGCGIYSMRPEEPCRAFFCGWQVNEDMPDWMIPAKSRVIITLNFVWEKPGENVAVHMAIAAGPKIPGKTLSWLRNYARKTQYNFLCHEHVRKNKAYTGEMRVFGIGSDKFEADVDAWNRAGHEFTVNPSKSRLVIDGQFIIHRQR